MTTADHLAPRPRPPIPVARPFVGHEEAAAVAATLASGWVAQGPKVAAFEQAVADAVGAEEGVAVSSGTAALHLALLLAGVAPGDEVVVPSLSFIAAMNVAVQAGARPVFADVDVTTGNVTVDTLDVVITERTRAVIVVHQAGSPADLAPVLALCDARGVAVIEDAACALGSTYRGRRIGAHSPLVAFSFHPRKVITTGEGGMLMVADPLLATRARRLREHGMSISAADRHDGGGVVVEEYLETGFNYRMSDIHAAVGLVQLTRLAEVVRRRRHLAARYHAAFAGVPGVEVIGGDPPEGTTNYQAFWVHLGDDVTADRDEIIVRLAAEGIATRRGIMAAHLEPAGAPFADVRLPVTERLASRSLLLPLYPDLDAHDQERVIDRFLAAVRR